MPLRRGVWQFIGASSPVPRRTGHGGRSLCFLSEASSLSLSAHSPESVFAFLFSISAAFSAIGRAHLYISINQKPPTTTSAIFRPRARFKIQSGILTVALHSMGHRDRLSRQGPALVLTSRKRRYRRLSVASGRTHSLTTAKLRDWLARTFPGRRDYHLRLAKSPPRYSEVAA